MKGVGVAALFFALAFLAESKSWSAIRTIQFVGTSINHTSKILPNQFPEFTACSVMIVNTGISDQIVNAGEVKFNTFDPNNGNKLQRDVPVAVQAVYNPGNAPDSPSCSGGGGAGSSCAGQVVSPGGFYVGIAYITPAALAGKLISICSGRFQVIDSNPQQPGSMAATGSISYLSELGITGGQFNGALYVSGSFVPPALMTANGPVAADNVWTNSAASSQPALNSTLRNGGFAGAANMNLFCADACIKFAGPALQNADYCDAACGMIKSNWSNNSDPMSAVFGGVTSRYRSASSFIEESDKTKSIATGLTGTPSNFYTEAAPGAAPDMRGLIRSANPHWAGGLVQEMIIGPFESICSGNHAYYSGLNPNTDFSHIDTISGDSDLVIARAGQTDDHPPERLFCSHTHMKDSPYGYVTATTQFAINGGAAF